MPRIRAIKPEFFTHERLAELSPIDRLFFIGLWTVADREGRLENRPKRLKVLLMPYDDYDVITGTSRLEHGGHIQCYRDEAGHDFIAIPSWTKHQRPHHTERPSELPIPLKVIETPLDNGESTEDFRSLTPGVGVGVGVGVQGTDARTREPSEPARRHPIKALLVAFDKAWTARYHAPYVRTAGGADAKLAQRILAAVDLERAVTAAQGYVRSQKPFYVQAHHPFRLFASNVNEFLGVDATRVIAPETGTNYEGAPWPWRAACEADHGNACRDWAEHHARCEREACAKRASA